MEQDRRAPRLELSFPVLVESGGEVRRHRAANVSEQGMMFLAPEPYLLGTQVKVIFCLPWTDVEFVTVGEVIHVDWEVERGEGLFHIGVQFTAFEVDEPFLPLRALPC